MANEIKVVLQQTSPTTSEATIRQHKVLVDRPAAKGGTDLGPMGGELFLSAVGGCFMSNLLAAFRARNAEPPNISAEVSGTLAESPSRFVAINVHVTAEGGDQALLERLVTIADRGCIMMNTLRDKLPVEIRTGAATAAPR